MKCFEDSLSNLRLSFVVGDNSYCGKVVQTQKNMVAKEAIGYFRVKSVLEAADVASKRH